MDDINTMCNGWEHDNTYTQRYKSPYINTREIDHNNIYIPLLKLIKIFSQTTITPHKQPSDLIFHLQYKNYKSKKANTIEKQIWH